MSGLSNPHAYKDKYVEHFHPVFNEFRKDRVRPYVTKGLIAEHAANPIGLRPNFHSLELQFVLAYFRTISEHAFYLPFELPGAHGFGIIAARKGHRPEVLDEKYASVDMARHAIFLRRVAELGIDQLGEASNV